MEPLASVLAEPSRCEYLPEQTWQLRYDLVPQLDASDYARRLRAGWRRFGYVSFRPECPACRRCQSLRVPADRFTPNESQRRVLRMNHGQTTLRVGPPAMSREKLDLWTKFHAYGQSAKGWPAADPDGLASFFRNPFATEEWTYTVDERLVAFGYVDALPELLSALYFVHDPDERHRSLGIYNVLSIIAAARERGVPHVYLGYFVEGCRSLEYKARFRPNEVLGADGSWEAFR